MKTTELNLIANRIRTTFALKTELPQAGLTQAEVDAIITQYLIDHPQDTTLTDAQVNTIIEAYLIANPPTDQVRTDQEINALISLYLTNHPEVVMTEQEVIDIHNAHTSPADELTQAEIDAIVDTVLAGGGGGGGTPALLTSADPFGDASLLHAYLFENGGEDLLGGLDLTIPATATVANSIYTNPAGGAVADLMDLPFTVKDKNTTTFFTSVYDEIDNGVVFVGLGNGTSSTRLYVKWYVNSINVPSVYIQWRDGSNTGSYFYQSYVVDGNVKAQGDKTTVAITLRPSGYYEDIYIDGVLATPNGSAGPTPTKNQPNGTVKLGAVTSNNTSYTFVESKVDSIHDFNRQLTGAEILQLHNAYIGA